VAYEAVAAALGYERNAAPLRELAAAVPLATVRALGAPAGRRSDPPAAEALLLGRAGLLPSQRHLPAARVGRDAGQDGGPAALEARWRSLGLEPALRAYRWDWSAGRPENAPVRRVVALAHLALRWPRGGLLPAVRRILEGEGDPRAAARRLARLVTLPPATGYWVARWDFGVPAGSRGAGALLGDSRAADVVVNVLLPLAATGARWAGAARAVYLAHPALAENWITRLVRQRAALGAAPRRAVVQQGLIGVFETTCRDLLCARCPLGAAHGAVHGGAIGGSGGLVVEGGAEGGSGLPGEALEGL
jgi:hypothetical protein